MLKTLTRSRTELVEYLWIDRVQEKKSRGCNQFAKSLMQEASHVKVNLLFIVQNNLLEIIFSITDDVEKQSEMHFTVGGNNILRSV